PQSQRRTHLTKRSRMPMDWAEASALVADAQRVLIVTHIGPDGDAIGSLCGLASALRGMGKQVTMAVDDGVPPELQFIPGAGEVHAALDKVDVDLCIAVDCGDERRMGEVGRVAQLTGRPLINLDHHPTNTFFGDTKDRKSTRLNSSHVIISYAVFCLKKKSRPRQGRLVNFHVSSTSFFHENAEPSQCYDCHGNRFRSHFHTHFNRSSDRCKWVSVQGM